MPSFFNNAFASFFNRIFQVSQTSNTGVDATTRIVHDGAGQSTSISLSDDVLSVQPVTDNTTATMLVKNQGGSNIFAIDTSATGTASTSKGRVLMGTSQVVANTQYAYFGTDSGTSSGFLADQHYAISFNNSPVGSSTDNAMGSATSSSFNDTNPASSLTISSTAMDIVNAYWYVMDDITIDAVKWFHGADTATGEDTAAHLMAYTVDIANGSTGGDLSSGVVVADGGNITNAGYEQIYYQSMTVQSADVDAGKVIMFTFASDTVNSDYSISANIKYHIR